MRRIYSVNGKNYLNLREVINFSDYSIKDNDNLDAVIRYVNNITIIQGELSYYDVFKYLSDVKGLCYIRKVMSASTHKEKANRNLILWVMLKICGLSVGALARRLDISRNTCYTAINKHENNVIKDLNYYHKTIDLIDLVNKLR